MAAVQEARVRLIWLSQTFFPCAFPGIPVKFARQSFHFLGEEDNISSNWLAVVIGGVFALVFGGFGIIMVLVYISARMRLAASQNWPSVEGRIDESRVHRLTSTSHGHTTSSYAPEVKYTYSVMGTAYQGSHIGFGVTMSSLHPSVEKIVARFPAGETRTVYYNPQKPAQAVLERDLENNVKALIVPIVCLLIGIGSCLVTAGMLYSRFR